MHVNLFLFLATLLAANGLSADPRAEKTSALVNQIKTLQDVLDRINNLRLDATEFACLKALVLFKPGRSI